MMLRPLTMAVPCKGICLIVIEVAVPVMLGTRVVAVLFASIFVVLDVRLGATAVTVSEMVATAEVPPGPVAV